MKKWRCNECGSRKTSDDNVVMRLCGSCRDEMEDVTDEEKEGEEDDE